MRKGRPLEFALPKIETAADAVRALAAVTQHTSSGELTPDGAQAVTGALQSVLKGYATVAIEQRLAAMARDGGHKMTLAMLRRLERIEDAILVSSRAPNVARVTLDRERPNLVGPDGRRTTRAC